MEKILFIGFQLISITTKMSSRFSTVKLHQNLSKRTWSRFWRLLLYALPSFQIYALLWERSSRCLLMPIHALTSLLTTLLTNRGRFLCSYFSNNCSLSLNVQISSKYDSKSPTLAKSFSNILWFFIYSEGLGLPIRWHRFLMCYICNVWCYKKTFYCDLIINLGYLDCFYVLMLVIFSVIMYDCSFHLFQYLLNSILLRQENRNIMFNQFNILPQASENEMQALAILFFSFLWHCTWMYRWGKMQVYWRFSIKQIMIGTLDHKNSAFSSNPGRKPWQIAWNNSVSCIRIQSSSTIIIFVSSENKVFKTPENGKHLTGFHQRSSYFLSPICYHKSLWSISMYKQHSTHRVID